MQDFYHLKRDNNPLREEAFTLSCLGKLYPASSSEFLRCGSWLSGVLDELDVEAHSGHDILIAGLTESGIIPALLMYLESHRRDFNTHLIYSTRRSMAGIPFNESHSHGPDHILPLLNCSFKEVWIVEDEITSGNTVLNLIFQLHSHMEIERVRIFAFADFRNREQKANLLYRTAESNICCSVHIPDFFQKETSGVCTATESIQINAHERGSQGTSNAGADYYPPLNRANNNLPLHIQINNMNTINEAGLVMSGANLSAEENSGDDVDTNWHLQARRPAIGVKSGNFFDPQFWSVPSQFSNGTLLTVGESVDMAACLAWANDSISFQQISLSPWKVDNRAIFSRMTFADKYYLYNYEHLNEPVYIICDPIDRDIEIEVIEKLQSHGICVKPFIPITEGKMGTCPQSFFIKESKSKVNVSKSERECISGRMNVNARENESLNAKTKRNTFLRSPNGLSWDQFFYLNLEKEAHPFNDLNRFRPLNKAYTGNNTFWSTPSPEPDLSDTFWQDVALSFNHDTTIQEAAQHLAASILQHYPDPEKIIFVSILRAGVPITDWLCQLLPGSVGAAVSLFVGLGIDQVALDHLRRDFPDRSIIFVDGWTGRGGVAKAISALDAGPLAVLIDPWGWANFSGIQEDVFCPSACFTGLATLGFSRTFFVDEHNLFSAYKFAEEFAQTDLVERWQHRCPTPPISSQKSGINKINDNRISQFFAETPLRIHSNEVCRALINAAPEILFFADDKSVVEQKFSLLLQLADQRAVPSEFNVNHLKDLRTKVACSLEAVR